jgi:phosphatidylserine/phosphatidylglycerophosphate/cardiolipin synthase-like enzyme
MKMLGGSEWTRGDVIALAGVFIGLVGTVAAVLAIPGMPPLLHRNPEGSRPARTTHGVVTRSFSVFSDPDPNSVIVGTASAGHEVTIQPAGDDPNWVSIRADSLQGWAMVQDLVGQELDGPGTIRLGQGYGYQGKFWKVFFTSPQPEGAKPNQFGIDMRFVDAVERTKKSLDVAVFELKSKLITDAIIDAYSRGVKVRIVTGQLGYKEQGATFNQLEGAHIPLVVRPDKSALMHSKFAIFDGSTVWTGSWNYTENATYANNENAVVLDGAAFAACYQRVFNQMFEDHLFGENRRKQGGSGAGQSTECRLGDGITILFAPEDPILPELIARVKAAKRSITILAFELTSHELAEALSAKARENVIVRGVFDRAFARVSTPVKSFCAPESGLQFRISSNKHFLHHDVLVMDDETVITGSPDFSDVGMNRNDENTVIIPDPLLARKYMAEFWRLWAKATAPDETFCGPTRTSK